MVRRHIVPMTDTATGDPSTINAHASAGALHRNRHASDPRVGERGALAWLARRSARQRAALAFIAGAVGALGFEPVALWPLLILALTALVLLCEARPRTALATGWWWGLGNFVVGLNWIAQSWTYQAAMPVWVGWVTVVLLSALLATMPALACLATWRLARRPSARAFGFAAAWMLFEWLRGWLFSGFPWNPLAAIAVDWAALPAMWGGLGTSGLIALLCAGLALSPRMRWSTRERVGSVIIFAGLLAMAVHAAEPATVRAPGPQLLIVQPNIGQEEKWLPGNERRHLATLMTLSRQPAPEAPRIILWPEVALPGAELAAEPALRATLATLLRPGDLLLTGGLFVERDPQGYPLVARNSMFAIDAEGRILARYDKSHLTPGGEYLPLRPFLAQLGLDRLAPGDLDFSPGEGPRTLALPGAPDVGPLICYEIIFPGAIVSDERRPAWLFNPSNDAWFGGWGPPQHLAMARLRASEEGLPIARSTPTGISAVIDAEGDLIEALPQGVAGTITATLPSERPPTPFARFGHLTALALGLLFALLALAADRRRT